jgi:Mg2+ and Co2+ transporter CorA
MATVRDFEMRPRSETTATLPVPASPVDRERSSNFVARRASTLSHRSNRSVDENGDFRHPSRTQTVTAYHPPDHSEPVWQPGAEPGIDTSAGDESVPNEVSSLKAECRITVIDFSATDVRHNDATNETLENLLNDPTPNDLPCRWISINGLSWDVIKCIGNKFGLHRLAIEDMVHTHTRTKVDWYADHACVILTLQKLVRLHRCSRHEQCDCPDAGLDRHGMPKHQKPWQPAYWQRKPPKRQNSELPYYLDKDGDGKVDEFVQAHATTSTSAPVKQVRTLHRYESSQIPEHTAFMEDHSTLSAENLSVSVEQVSIFLLDNNTVISFFEHSAEDVEGPIRDRLQSTETVLRRSCDASLLLEAIIDAIVDLAVPVKDAYNKARKELQVDALISPNIKTSRSLHIFGEEIDMLQNLIKPIVHLVNALRDHYSEPMPLPPQISGAQLPKIQIQEPSPARGDHNKRGRGETPAHTRSSEVGQLKRSDTASVSSVTITPLARTYFGDVLDHCM